MRTFVIVLVFVAAGALLFGQEPQSTTSVPTQPSSDLPGRTWTSLTTSNDYRVRLDSDYIYTEQTNVPPELSTSAFSRGELKKTGTIWIGHTKMHFPCQYKDISSGETKTNWITLDPQIEITRMTDTRIEGRTQNYSSGYDCQTGKPKDDPVWTSFTWIPKEHEAETKQSPIAQGGQPPQGSGGRATQVYGQGTATAANQSEGDSIAYSQAVAQVGAKCIRGRVANIIRTSGQCFGNPGIGGFPSQYQCTVSVKAICE